MVGDYDELIRANCETFLGYGPDDLATAHVWFIGTQQGGGYTPEEVCERLRVWHARGRRTVDDTVDDIVAYHRAIRADKWFVGDPPQVQKTWGELVRIRLSKADARISEPSIAKYQAERMAGRNGENCLLELLPLAAPKPDDMRVYTQISALDWLTDEHALLAK